VRTDTYGDGVYQEFARAGIYQAQIPLIGGLCLHKHCFGTEVSLSLLQFEEHSNLPGSYLLTITDGETDGWTDGRMAAFPDTDGQIT